MKKNNKKGFTLVELVIVVAVMAILVAVAIPTLNSVKSSAQLSVGKSNAKTIESIIKLAEADEEFADIAEGGEDVYYANAIAAAKLGIDDGEFYYNSENGRVYYSEDEDKTEVEGDDSYFADIVFADGEVTVNEEAPAEEDDEG